MTEHIRFMKHASSCTLSDVKKEMIAYQRKKFNIFQERLPSHIYGLRLETVNVCGENTFYRRVFVKCHDSGEYAKVGWILNEDCKNCMICQHPLTSRHHCRACGNILCNNCCDTFERVDLIDSLGEVRVCMLCYYGQSPVEAKINCREGMKLFGKFDHDIEEESAATEIKSNISSMINLCDFGALEYHSIDSMFLIQSSLRQSHQRIYFHICASDFLPYNSDNILLGGEKLIYFVINSPRLPGKPIGSTVVNNEKPKRKSGTGDHTVATASGLLEYLIYEVIVHPNVIKEVVSNPQYLNQVCGQIILSLPLITPQVGVENYQLITSVEKKQKVLRMDRKKSRNDDDGQILDDFTTMQMLLPSKKSILELYHLYINENYYTTISKNVSQSDSMKRQLTQSSAQYRKYIENLFSAQARLLMSLKVPPQILKTAAYMLPKLTRFVDIVPSPGFVIKTRRIFQAEPTLPPDHPLSAKHSSGSHAKYIVSATSILDPDYKVFINVYYHPVVKDILKNEFLKDRPIDNFLLLIHNKIENVYDKDRQLSDLYHVAVSSDYFVKAFASSAKNINNPGEGKLITDNYFIEKIVKALNDRFEDNLDHVEFNLPRMKGGQKGERISGNATMQFEYMIPNPIPSILPVVKLEEKKINSSTHKSVENSGNSTVHKKVEEKQSANIVHKTQSSISQTFSNFITRTVAPKSSTTTNSTPKTSVAAPPPAPSPVPTPSPVVITPVVEAVTAEKLPTPSVTPTSPLPVQSTTVSPPQPPTPAPRPPTPPVEQSHEIIPSAVTESSIATHPPAPSSITTEFVSEPILPQTSHESDEEVNIDDDDDNDRHSDVSDVSLASSIASSTVSFMPSTALPYPQNTRNVLPFAPHHISSASSVGDGAAGIGGNHGEKHKLKAHRHSIFQMLYPKTTITTMASSHYPSGMHHHPLERPPDASYYPQSTSSPDNITPHPKTVSIVLPEKGEGGEESIRIPLEITPEMVHYDLGEMMDWRDAAALKQQSITQPAVLLGWQIMLYDKLQNTEIYVVTGIRKNALRKSEFQLRNCVDDEPIWTKLKRSEKKSGRFFRPLRKVVYLDTETGDDGSGAGGTWTSSFAARDSESVGPQHSRSQSILFDEQITTTASSTADTASVSSSSGSTVATGSTSGIAAAKNFFGSLRRGSTGGIGLSKNKNAIGTPLSTTSPAAGYGITKVSDGKASSSTANANSSGDQKTAWEEEQWLRNTIEQQQATSFVHHLATTNNNNNNSTSNANNSSSASIVSNQKA